MFKTHTKMTQFQCTATEIYDPATSNWLQYDDNKKFKKNSERVEKTWLALQGLSPVMMIRIVPYPDCFQKVFFSKVLR